MATPVVSPPSISTRQYPNSLPRAMTYVQTFHTVSGANLSLLPLERTGLTHVYLASLHINEEYADITLNDDNPNSTVWDTVWSEAAQLQQRGLKVLMLLGGAAQGSYQRLCSGAGNDTINTHYYTPLVETLRYHNIDGLDLDIEEVVDLECPLALLRHLYDDFGPEFILTMAPVASSLQPGGVGLGGFSYSELDAKALAPDKPNGKLVNWFNAQFYNGFGDASSDVGYNAIINHGYAPSRVVLGILDSPNDGGSGWYNLSTYERTIKQLRVNYPDFGDVISWEYWDAGVGDNIPEPYIWESDIAFTELGPIGAGDVSNTTGAPVPYGAAPWPAYQNVLVDYGVPWLEAVVALNVTNGDLAAAEQLLNITTNNRI